MFACHEGDKIILQLLLDNSDKIELNAKDDNGCTAFMHACQSGHKHAVQLLLDHSNKIELNAKDENECTAFMHACQNGDTYLVKLLLNHSDKIELNAKNIDALHQCLLALKRHHDIVHLLSSQGTTSNLLVQG